MMDLPNLMQQHEDRLSEADLHLVQQHNARRMQALAQQGMNFAGLQENIRLTVLCETLGIEERVQQVLGQTLTELENQVPNLVTRARLLQPGAAPPGRPG